ncbi:hypothetical protein GMAR_ORF34 [Golden Marseillevirus]|uniref:hypothetical protein n=1 Tax=Golden Marseillevirus TaxID=1720526 RepID=UPI000877AD3C|nr:hypothetical protein GMAR_ORF34 [Golden Marseillevirus]ALX27409.1 hypothetical protein GMAR_ORF34 [Golden Marseillevirus]
MQKYLGPREKISLCLVNKFEIDPNEYTKTEKSYGEIDFPFGSDLSAGLSPPYIAGCKFYTKFYRIPGKKKVQRLPNGLKHGKMSCNTASRILSVEGSFYMGQKHGIFKYSTLLRPETVVVEKWEHNFLKYRKVKEGERVTVIEFYKKDRSSGLKQIYSGGRTIESICFKDNLLHGLYFRLDVRRGVTYKATYENGRSNKVLEFYPNGKMLLITENQIWGGEDHKVQKRQKSSSREILWSETSWFLPKV